MASRDQKQQAVLRTWATHRVRHCTLPNAYRTMCEQEHGRMQALAHNILDRITPSPRKARTSHTRRHDSHHKHPNMRRTCGGGC